MRETRWNDASFQSELESRIWTSSSVVRRYLHRLASGDENCDWLTYVESRHLAPSLASALVLGCGGGWLERALAGRGRFRSIIACDFAADSVARARDEAAAAGFPGIDYRVVDLEHEALGGPYDAVFANDVLHHITNLEDLYERILQSLAPEGKFIFSEYVGPNRFQFSDQRMDLVNRYLRLLPDRLRHDPSRGSATTKKERPDADQVVREDPTEAVRSEEVVPLVRRYFRTEKEYPYGGSLLNPLLSDIIVNFCEDVPEDVRLLEVLCGAEDRLIRSGQLEPDFVIFVGARP
ncbi:MAG TPA: class I SAM-dependent methyltransferase [Thermoanaerobaculia bacterium]|nr:class I SAM-dependent methyltransferase [Thermoanaerobaculia bacterium]